MFIFRHPIRVTFIDHHLYNDQTSFFYDVF